MSTAKMFLFFALIWGVSLVFITPPGMVPDEPAHFFRAYQVSEFRFYPEIKNNELGAHLPVSLWKSIMDFGVFINNSVKNKDSSWIIRKFYFLELNSDKRFYMMFPNTSLYSPVSYAPQSAGIFTGRILRLPPLFLLYLARLFNLAFWMLLIFYSIKNIPFNKWIIVLLALLPMNIYLASSASADSVSIALSFFTVSYILKMAYAENVFLTWRNVATLSFLTVFLGLSKSIYVIIPALIVLIPVSKAGNFSAYLKKISVVFFTALLVFTGNALIVNSIISLVDPIEMFYGKYGDVPRINPVKQTDLVLADLPGFLLLIINSFQNGFSLMTRSFIGILGWVSISFSNIYYWVSWAVLFFVAIAGNTKRIKIRWKDRLVLLTGVVLLIIAFSFTMYCSWCNVGDPLIKNLQGRYFLPVAPIFFSIFYLRCGKLPKYIVPLISMLFIAASLILTIYKMLNEYYLYF